MKSLLSSLRMAFILLLLMTLLLGIAYPLLTMAVAQTLFHHKAQGSLIEKNGKIIGSELLGQEFTSPRYFWSRLSATTPPYNATASGASNLSPANPKLLEAGNQRLAALQQADPHNRMRVPVGLVTASASGLDPDISVVAAEYQLPRVARARGMKEKDVRALVDEYTQVAAFGLLGEPYVNVLRLNLALDEASRSGLQAPGKNK